MSSNHLRKYTKHEYEQALQDLIIMQKMSEAAQGKMLKEAKERTTHGEWEEFYKRAGYSQKKALGLIKLYTQFGESKENAKYSVTQMIELSRGDRETNEIVQEVLDEVIEEDDIYVSVDRLKAAKSIVTGKVEVPRDTIKSIMRQETNYELEKEVFDKSVTHVSQMIENLAFKVWEVDESAKEIARRIEINDDNLPYFQQLKSKLEQIFKEKGID